LTETFGVSKQSIEIIKNASDTSGMNNCSNNKDDSDRKNVK
jgi:hypothetical protein